MWKIMQMPVLSFFRCCMYVEILVPFTWTVLKWCSTSQIVYCFEFRHHKWQACSNFLKIPAFFLLNFMPFWVIGYWAPRYKLFLELSFCGLDAKSHVCIFLIISFIWHIACCCACPAHVQAAMLVRLSDIFWTHILDSNGHLHGCA